MPPAEATFTPALVTGGIALALLGATLWLAVRLIRNARADAQAADRRTAKEKDRVELLEKELKAIRERSEPDARVERLALDGLQRAVRELAACATREDVAAALGRAVVDSATPRQWMVFLAADEAGREFVVSASGCCEGATVWRPGARLGADTGRVGLAIRRKATIDRHDFEAEPPIVRDQVSRTEPADFRLDIVTPVIVGDRVVAVLAVGGPEVLLGLARTGLDVLASFATVVLRGLAAKERAERFANQDTLTGVGNKSWFNASAAEAIYDIRQHGGRASLVVFGIDAFQHYVRRNGHAAGDRLVRGVAQVLRPHLGEGVLLARWGGDEFIALLPDVDTVRAWKVAREARRAVSAVEWPFAAEQPGGRVTLCAGIASCPASGDTLEAVVESASQALTDARGSSGDTKDAVMVDAAAARDAEARRTGKDLAAAPAEDESSASADAVGVAVVHAVPERDETPSVVEEQIAPSSKD